MNNSVICYIMDYLDNNLYRDVSIDELSNYFGFDKTYLMKKFKAEIGFSIKSYVNKKRIYNSLNYLSSDELLLKIALQNGFNSLEYYSETFTKIMGVSPSIFKKYPDGDLSKIELESIMAALINYKEFNESIALYRNYALANNEHKVLRLSIPKEKKYVA